MNAQVHEKNSNASGGLEYFLRPEFATDHAARRRAKDAHGGLFCSVERDGREKGCYNFSLFLPEPWMEALDTSGNCVDEWLPQTMTFSTELTGTPNFFATSPFVDRKSVV